MPALPGQEIDLLFVKPTLCFPSTPFQAQLWEMWSSVFKCSFIRGSANWPRHLLAAALWASFYSVSLQVILNVGDNQIFWKFPSPSKAVAQVIILHSLISNQGKETPLTPASPHQGRESSSCLWIFSEEMMVLASEIQCLLPSSHTRHDRFINGNRSLHIPPISWIKSIFHWTLSSLTNFLLHSVINPQF